VPEPEIRIELLPYVDRLAQREPDSVDLVVIHCTELPDLDLAREYGERIHHAGTRTGNCGHFYIERSGALHQWVPLERAAHHVRGFNERSIGIELVNRGRFPHWLDSRHQTMTEPYTEAQLSALLALLQLLRSRLPGLRWIAGHDALDTELVSASDDPGRRVPRKCDPGPLFPWSRILTASGLHLLAGNASTDSPEADSG
jgi:N-acetylmuramoyl-L-alanine amidase